MPSRSSCSPGPSPTNIRSASGSPAPNTTCVRVSASGHFVQASATRSSSCERREHQWFRRRFEQGHGIPLDVRRVRAHLLRDRGSHRRGRDLGGEQAQAVDVRVDLRRWPARTRCRRRGGCATGGSPGRARGARSRRGAGTRASCSRALVATTASVVLLVLLERADPGKPGVPSGALEPASTRPSSSNTSPTAFTTTSAPTTTSPSRALAEPSPPGTAYSPPRHLPTVAPRPAPTRPIRSGPAARQRGRERGAALLGPGR